MKENQSKLLEERRLRESVKRHPEFIGFFIALYDEKSLENEVTVFEEVDVEKVKEEKKKITKMAKDSLP